MDLALSNDEVLGIFLPILVYWIYSGMYVILESFEKYKLHSKKEEEEKNLASRKTVIKGVLLQQTIQAFIIFLMFKLTGGNDGGEYPAWQPFSFIVAATQFVIAMLVLDTYQYFTHRYMHHNKFLYRHFHSHHHRLVVPYAFGALYSHQLDGLLFDTLGGTLANLISGMTPRTSVYFFCLAVIKAVDDHCGILIPETHFISFFGTILHFMISTISFMAPSTTSLNHFSLCGIELWEPICLIQLKKEQKGGFAARPLKEVTKDD